MDCRKKARSVVLLPLMLCIACSRSPAVPETALVSARPLALIQYGPGPLWFELGPRGPELIDSPAQASLRPFEPWPLSPLITGMLALEDTLVMAVNREGFLWILPRKDSADVKDAVALYRAADDSWSGYTAASPFFFEGIPAALLYRDDFFTEPAPVPPLPPVRGLIDGGVRGLEIPALAPFSGSGEDVDLLRQGGDGFWYYRAGQKGGAGTERRYFRTADLAVPGEASSSEAFIRALRPRPFREAPELLRRVLDRIPEIARGEQIAEVVSPGFNGGRQFGTDSGSGGDPLRGYYGGGLALIITPAGRGIYAREDETAGLFTLPMLPEGFVYTGIGVSGTALIAAWEEQNDLTVGAAGFLVIGLP